MNLGASAILDTMAEKWNLAAAWNVQNGDGERWFFIRVIRVIRGQEHFGRRLTEENGGRLRQQVKQSVAAIHDVINRARILPSPLADHSGRVAFAASCVNIKN